MEENPRHRTGEHRPLRVPVGPKEEEGIRKQAVGASLSVAAYLRDVGLGYRVSGIVDCQQARRLARINGDLGRLGGLLKLCPTNDEWTARFGAATIRALLGRMESTREQMARSLAAPYGQTRPKDYAAARL